MVARAELRTGDRIGAWTVEGRIGEGALGSVYGAANPAGAEVALKVWPAGHLPYAVRDQYFEDAAVAGNLEHPNLGVLVDVGETPSDLCFSATRRLKGAPLPKLLRRMGPLPPRDALHFSCEVARALEALHAVGLSHGDVHPGQVFLERGGSARLLDACQMTMKRAGRAAPSHWSPPEEHRGAPRGAAGDVYGLSRLVYEMTARRFPFTTDGLPPQSAALPRVLSAEPVSLADLAPELPRALWRTLRAALAPEPADRPSLREVALELRSALRRLLGKRSATEHAPLDTSLQSVTDLSREEPCNDTAARVEHGWDP